MRTWKFAGILVVLTSIITFVQSEAGSVSLHMERIWEISNRDSDPYLFGIIEDLVIDEQGNLYVLDTQLKDIKIFSSGGKFIRTIGREGDGPGELRAPGSLFIFPDGNLGVVSKMFGRITKLHPVSGDPIASFRVEGFESPNGSLGRVKGIPDSGLPGKLVGEITEAQGDQFLHWRRYLAIFEEASFGESSIPLIQIKEVGSNTGNASEIEEYYGLWHPWDVNSEGRIQLAPYWDSYILETYDPSGLLEKTTERPFEFRNRTHEEKNRFLDFLCGGVSPETMGIEFVVDEVEAVVRYVHTRPEGDVWVQTNRCGYDLEMETFIRLDAFDRNGKFLHQVELVGPGNPDLDRIYFHDEDILIVIHGAENFITNHRGRNKGQSDYDLTISGYKLIPSGSNMGQ